MQKLVIAIAAFALASSAYAQSAPTPGFVQASNPPAQQPQAAPISASMQRMIDRLQQRALASDHGYDIVQDLVTQIGPRLAASDAEARARDWAVAMLRAEGFTNVHVEPFTIPYWDATREEAFIVSPGGERRMVAAALGGSPSTPAGGLVGEIVRFPDMTAFEAAPNAAVAGRIVFIDERMIATQDGSGYGVAVRKRGRCAPVAQAKGALGCLIRSVGTDDHFTTSNSLVCTALPSSETSTLYLPTARPVACAMWNSLVPLPLNAMSRLSLLTSTTSVLPALT